MLNDFSNCTNLTASCHFDNVDFVAQSSTTPNQKPNNTNSFDTTKNEHFCHLVHQSGQLYKCQRQDQYYKELAKKEKRTVIYSCHAGLCETITPIIFDNIVIGHIICGKFIDADYKYSSVEKVKAFAQKSGVDETQLLSYYEKLPVVSAKQIRGAINILNICITHIVEKHFIQLKNTALAEQIKAYVLENLSSSLSVDEICKAFFINRQKLHTIFKANFNDNVKHFIITQRLAKAKELLRTTKKTIEEISFDTGFPNYNYFIRVFRNHFSITPLQYRKSFLAKKRIQILKMIFTFNYFINGSMFRVIFCIKNLALIHARLKKILNFNPLINRQH